MESGGTGLVIQEGVQAQATEPANGSTANGVSAGGTISGEQEAQASSVGGSPNPAAASTAVKEGDEECRTVAEPGHIAEQNGEAHEQGLTKMSRTDLSSVADVSSENAPQTNGTQTNETHTENSSESLKTNDETNVSMGKPSNAEKPDEKKNHTPSKKRKGRQKESEEKDAVSKEKDATSKNDVKNFWKEDGQKGKGSKKSFNSGAGKGWKGVYAKDACIESDENDENESPHRKGKGFNYLKETHGGLLLDLRTKNLSDGKSVRPLLSDALANEIWKRVRTRWCKEKGTAQGSEKGVYLDVDISENYLNPNGCAAMCEFLRKLHRNATTTCNSWDSGTMKIPVSVRALRMFKNNVGDEGMKFLAELVIDQPKPMMELHLSHNDITDQGAAILVTSFGVRKDTYPFKLTKRHNRQLYGGCWIRLERNEVEAPGELVHALKNRGAVVLDESTREQEEWGPDRAPCWATKPDGVPQAILHIFHVQRGENGWGKGTTDKKRKMASQCARAAEMVVKEIAAKCVRNKESKIATPNENAEVIKESEQNGGVAKEWVRKVPNEGSNGSVANEVEGARSDQSENRKKSDRPDLEKAYDMIHDIPLSAVPAGDALRTRWLTHVAESENPAKEAERIVQMAVQMCQQTYPDAKAWAPIRMPMNFNQSPTTLSVSDALSPQRDWSGSGRNGRFGGSPPRPRGGSPQTPAQANPAGIKAGAMLLQGLQPRPNRNGGRTSPQRLQTMEQVEADLVNSQWQGPPPPMHPVPAIGSSVVQSTTRRIRNRFQRAESDSLATSGSAHNMAGSVPIPFDSAPEPLCSSKKGKNKIGNWMQAKVGADEPTRTNCPNISAFLPPPPQPPAKPSLGQSALSLFQ